MRDPYKTLGVRPDAGADEIKAAWRTMAKAVHPDHNKDDPNATARFAEMGRAYETLKDPKKRSHYDKIASMKDVRGSGPTIMQQRQAAREAEERAKQARANAERVMEELARAKAKKAAEAAAEAAAAQPKPAAAATAAQPNAERAQGQASAKQAQSQTTAETPEDMVERIFGARPSAAQNDKPAATAETAPKPTDEPAADTTTATEDLADADGVVAPSALDSIISLPPFGIIKSLVRRLTGNTPPVQEKAPEIAATASVTVDDIIKGNTITVPLGDGREVRFQAAAGMDDGHVVHLKGQGLKLQGMLRGDVAVTVSLAAHERFTIRGSDLHTTLPITIENAVLGWQTSVEGLNGRLPVTVPAWSSSDQIIRISGQGLPDAGGGKGDLVIELRLMLWEKPDDKVTDLMRAMKSGLVL